MLSTRITCFLSLPLEWKFCGFVLHQEPLGSAPEVALCFSGNCYMNSTFLGVLDKGTHLIPGCVKSSCYL